MVDPIKEISKNQWEKEYIWIAAIVNCGSVRKELSSHSDKFRCWSKVDDKYIIAGITEDTKFIYVTKKSINHNIIVKI